MSASLIDACNEALSEIAKAPIQSLSEASIEARECNRFAPKLLNEMAEWTEWPEQIKRVTLAVVPNDRSAEWLYAYAEPTDMADPIAVRKVEDEATGLPIATLNTLPVQDAFPLRFIVEGKVIYTNVENAMLVYTKTDLAVEDMTATMRRAFVLALAHRLAMPVAKDRKLRDALSNDAEIARGRAISDAMNRTQRYETEHVSEAELAREGIEL